MITYLTGDATAAEKGIIAHVCNDLGAWGAGFVLALSARWPQPRDAYAEWALHGADFGRGNVQLVPVSDDLAVANMVAQRGLPSRDYPVALDYEALGRCLDALTSLAPLEYGTVIHMPRIGCGLAGGDWGRVESLINYHLNGYDVRVYDLPEKQ